MSGRQTGTNVVPMPTAPAPAPAPMHGTWPPSGGWGGFPAGCCPPGGMDALLQCYCDIQAATAFISKVVQDLAANDPAFQQSLVDAIAASGSNIPLIGVTNGADAQPGQVGEWVQFIQNVTYTSAALSTTLTMGVLQPGDWDCWLYATDFSGFYNDVNYTLNPLPAGFVGNINAGNVQQSGTVASVSIPSTTVRALTTVPSLIAVQLLINQIATGGGGTMDMVFRARRVR